MNNWVDIAAELKFDKNVSWTKIVQAMKEQGYSLTFDQIRETLRRHPRYKSNDSENQDTTEHVLKLIEKPIKTNEICQKLKITSRVLSAVLEDLREIGFIIEEDNETVFICKDIKPSENNYVLNWRGEKIIRFGLCGDNQSGSKYTQITHLHNFYDICQHEGIETVYHTGDIDEGEEMRQGHKYECYIQGADDHVQELIKTYPKREGITTEFITGNHDWSIIKRAGYDIGVTIAKERPDMKYLGQGSAMIDLTPNCKLELRHPIDGTAYAHSYKIQKMIEAIQGGDKPNVLAVGHYHKAEYLPYRNVHAIQTGCFQAQTPWMKGKQIAAVVGGWIIEIHVDDEGSIHRFKSEFFPYYKMIKDDYMNWR